MALVTITEKVQTPPTPDEQRAEFVKQIRAAIEAEGRRRKQFLETLLAGIWDSGIQYYPGPNGARFPVQVGLTPEDKFGALNDAGMSAGLFTAGAEDEALLLKYVAGLTVDKPANKDNYSYTVAQDGKVTLTKKA